MLVLLFCPIIWGVAGNWLYFSRLRKTSSIFGFVKIWSYFLEFHIQNGNNFFKILKKRFLVSYFWDMNIWSINFLDILFFENDFPD